MRIRAGYLALAAGAALAVVALVFILAAGEDEQPLGGNTPPGETESRTAKRADDFVESIGVNVHLAFTTGPYVVDFDTWKAKLDAAGIRYVRDGISGWSGATWSGFADRVRDLFATYGIKTQLIVGNPDLPTQRLLDFIKDRDMVSSLSGVEGVNEWDGFGEQAYPQPTARQIRAHQIDLWRRVKGDGALRRLPVVGPSPGLRWGTDAKPTEIGDLSAHLDYGNRHSYPGGRRPEHALGQEIARARFASRDEPIMVTETGYHTAVASKGGHPAVSEQAAGIYFPRLFLEYFRRGFVRTYAYELLDQSPNPRRDDLQANFGLLRSDFSEKPAFTAIKRLIALLRDPGPRFKPERLDFAVAGAPPKLRQLLLQKRDGAFYLALWNQVSVWDQGKLAPPDRGGADVRLVLGRAARQVEVYRPGDSGRPLMRRSNVKSLPLRVSPRVAVVKIRTGV